MQEADIRTCRHMHTTHAHPLKHNTLVRMQSDTTCSYTMFVHTKHMFSSTCGQHTLLRAHVHIPYPYPCAHIAHRVHLHMHTTHTHTLFHGEPRSASIPSSPSSPASHSPNQPLSPSWRQQWQGGPCSREVLRTHSTQRLWIKTSSEVEPSQGSPGSPWGPMA